MAATTLSFPEYKPNVPHSNFTVFYSSRTKESTKLSHLTSGIRLGEKKTEAESPALTENWLTGISPNDSPHFLGNSGGRMILTSAVWPHGKYLPNPKIWRSAWPEPWTRSACHHSGKDGCTCHLGTLFCPIWVFLFNCGVYSLHFMCLCEVFCVCTQFFTTEKFLPWSLMPEVQCLLFEIDSFVWNNTGDNPELVFCMDHGWKTGDYICSRPAEITTTTPYSCLWHPDEEGNSSADWGRALHC